MPRPHAGSKKDDIGVPDVAPVDLITRNPLRPENAAPDSRPDFVR
jgi:hypothetical protein